MRRKRKKRLILALILVFLAAAALSPFAVNAHVTHTAEAGIVTAEEAAAAGPADCVLVLGALVYPDGRLSAMLEDRVKTGISLYQSGAAKKLLFTGDHGREDYDEVNAMKRYALEAGVPEEDIFLDHAGFSTYESVYRAKAVFQVESVVIVDFMISLSSIMGFSSSSCSVVTPGSGSDVTMPVPTSVAHAVSDNTAISAAAN